jgi:hypothetical protein
MASRQICLDIGPFLCQERVIMLVSAQQIDCPGAQALPDGLISG